MAVVKHSTAVLDGSNGTFTDRTIIGLQLAVANASGGAGVAVTTVVTFPEPLPPTYTVVIQAYQDCTSYVTTKTTFGFSVVLTPRLAANSLASGTFDVMIVG
jgi:hypothetical protein